MLWQAGLVKLLLGRDEGQRIQEVDAEEVAAGDRHRRYGKDQRGDELPEEWLRTIGGHAGPPTSSGGRAWALG